MQNTVIDLDFMIPPRRLLFRSSRSPPCQYHIICDEVVNLKTLEGSVFELPSVQFCR